MLTNRLLLGGRSAGWKELGNLVDDSESRMNLQMENRMHFVPPMQFVGWLK